jgi:hypothetical protein
MSTAATTKAKKRRRLKKGAAEDARRVAVMEGRSCASVPRKQGLAVSDSVQAIGVMQKKAGDDNPLNDSARVCAELAALGSEEA